MVLVGVALTALGLLSILFEPHWLPRYVRRVLPHTGYVLLGFAAIADRVTVAHIDGQVALTPDSSLRIVAPALLKAEPRTVVTLLPPQFIGSPLTVDLALQLAIAGVVAAIIIALIRPEWLRPITRWVGRGGLALVVILVAWTTGIESRTLNVIRDRVRVDGDAPLRSIAELIGAIPGEYQRSAAVMLLVLGIMLCVWGLRYTVLALQRLRRRSRQWNAA